MSAWRNRIVGYGEEAPDQLLAHPQNFRIHPGDQQDAMGGVLDEVGIVQNVIVNRTTGHVLDGHLRIKLALRQGQPTVPITYVELSEAEEKLVLATLDQITELAGRDKVLLRELLEDVGPVDDPALNGLLDDLLASAGQGEPDASGDDDGDGVDEYDPGNPVIQFNIVFDTERQQGRWYDFTRWLKTTYPDAETLGERLESYINEQGFPGDDLRGGGV